MALGEKSAGSPGTTRWRVKITPPDDDSARTRAGSRDSQSTSKTARITAYLPDMAGSGRDAGRGGSNVAIGKTRVEQALACLGHLVRVGILCRHQNETPVQSVEEWQTGRRPDAASHQHDHLVEIGQGLDQGQRLGR